jgi:hypothetical protein
MQKKSPSQPKVSPYRGLLSALGSAAGGYLGGPVGAILGKGAGDLISKITGFGAYKVNRNTLLTGNTVPSFRGSGDGVEICHREFVANVKSVTGFAVGDFHINPGLAQTFPFLSQIAAYFEEYDMMGLVFEYRPSSGSAVSGTNPAMGVVVYATDYNALAPNFISKQQMESYEYSCSCVPFESMLHPVECAPRNNALDTLYIRTSNTGTSTADLRLYDMGKFQVAATGQQASGNDIGELWVTYHVKLKKPRIDPVANARVDHIQSSAYGSGTAADPLGTIGGILTSGSSLNAVSNITSNSFVIATPGNYMIVERVYSSGADMSTSATLSFGSNISALPVQVDSTSFDDNDVSSVLNPSTGANAISILTCSVNAYDTGSDNTITLGGLASGTGLSTDVWVYQLPTYVN